MPTLGVNVFMLLLALISSVAIGVALVLLFVVLLGHIIVRHKKGEQVGWRWWARTWTMIVVFM
jgi:hypothetical protein